MMQATTQTDAPPDTAALFILGPIAANIDAFERHRPWFTPRLVLQWIAASPGVPPGEMLDRLVASLRRLQHAPLMPRLAAVLQSAVDFSRDERLMGREVLDEVLDGQSQWVCLE